MTNRRRSASPLAALALLLAALQAQAEPAPFGLELGRTTQGQAGVRYPLRPAGIHPDTLGEQFELDGCWLAVPGLRDLILIFGADRTLVGVQATAAPDRYEDLRRRLAAKHAPAEAPATGSAGVESHFRNGDTEIVLSAPAGADVLRLSYRHRRLIEAGEARRGREAKVRGMVDAGEL